MLGIDSLPATPGAWNEHTKRAYLQAHLWAQDNVLHPKILDPTTLGWESVSGQLIPVFCRNLTKPSKSIFLKIEFFSKIPSIVAPLPFQELFLTITL